MDGIEDHTSIAVEIISSFNRKTAIMFQYDGVKARIKEYENSNIIQIRYVQGGVQQLFPILIKIYNEFEYKN